MLLTKPSRVEDWSYSDSFFDAMLKAGTAPYLKLGVNTWTSTRLSGQSYVDWATGNVTYVIPPQIYFDCKPWPAIAPVMNAIGDRLVLKIVERYNKGGLLEAWKWPDAFAGVELLGSESKEAKWVEIQSEVARFRAASRRFSTFRMVSMCPLRLMNEWNMLTCQPFPFPCGEGPSPTARDWAPRPSAS